MSLELLMMRDASDGDCTLGIVAVGNHKLHTMEPALCVHAGIYRLLPYRSEQYPMAWALVNPALGVYLLPSDALRKTEARQALIHPGNSWWELHGGIIVGRNRSKVGGEWVMQQSRDAMNLLKTVIGSTLDVTLMISYKP